MTPDMYRNIYKVLGVLTTQVKRIADHTAQSTFTLAPPVVVSPDDAPTTGDDGRSRASRFLDAVTHSGPGYDYPAPAADEDALRTARRDSLLVLLSRAYRGTLIPEESELLRHHVETEIREGEQQRTRADQAEEDARRALEQRQEMAEERHALQEQRDAANRTRAEVQRDRDQHAAVLGDMLDRFTHKDHPGEPCLQTEWIPVATVERWRGVVAPTVEQPWWQQVAEARSELAQAQAAIERVRVLVAGIAHPTSAGIGEYDLGRHEMATAVVIALTETDQPTTEA